MFTAKKKFFKKWHIPTFYLSRNVLIYFLILLYVFCNFFIVVIRTDKICILFPWSLYCYFHCCYIDRRRQWHPLQYFLPGKSHGRRSLVGCSPWGCEELDTIERLYFHFSLSCIGEGNGNPFQCSCLGNPRDGGAWWAAVSGVAESDMTEVT